MSMMENDEKRKTKQKKMMYDDVAVNANDEKRKQRQIERQIGFKSQRLRRMCPRVPGMNPFAHRPAF